MNRAIKPGRASVPTSPDIVLESLQGRKSGLDRVSPYHGGRDLPLGFMATIHVRNSEVISFHEPFVGFVDWQRLTHVIVAQAAEPAVSPTA